jgi:TPR repeat protein
VLGSFFYNGIGVEKNNQEALKYLSMGCDLKSEQSCKNYRIVKNSAK